MKATSTLTLRCYIDTLISTQYQAFFASITLFQRLSTVLSGLGLAAEPNNPIFAAGMGRTPRDVMTSLDISCWNV